MRVLILILLLISCKAGEEKQSLGRRDLFFIKSHYAGSYYSAGSAWARLITSNTEFIGVNSTSPASDNEKVTMLIDNKMQAAFLKGPEASLAYHGDPVYWKEPQPVRAMFAMWPAVYNLITHSDTGIINIRDIKGKSIAIYSENSVNGDILEYLLGLYGITEKNTMIYRVRESIGINLFMRKEIDCIWYDLGYGESILTSQFFSSDDAASEAENHYLIPMEKDLKMREFLKIYPYYYLEKFGSGTGFNEEYQLMTSSFAVCSALMSDDIAYRLTKLWWENNDFVRQYVSETLDLINRTDNRNGVPIPFHKGALRYLIEAGLIPVPGESFFN